MKKLPKIQVSPITNEDLKKEKERNIRKCREIYAAFPIATKVWMAMKTKMPMTFLQNNWEEITA